MKQRQKNLLNYCKRDGIKLMEDVDIQTIAN